jgi:hypothetical protein
MDNTTNRRLIVSQQDEAGEVFRLGTLDFDESNRATLATEGSGPAVEELTNAWEEISKLPELTWKQSRPEEIDGRRVTRIMGVESKPGDDNYIYAVLNTLERKYGFTVELAE